MMEMVKIVGMEIEQVAYFKYCLLHIWRYLHGWSFVVAVRHGYADIIKRYEGVY